MSNHCKGIWGRVFGHNYEPVFNTLPPAPESFNDLPPSAMAYVESLTSGTHVPTFCTRCGDVIPKNENE